MKRIFVMIVLVILSACISSGSKGSTTSSTTPAPDLSLDDLTVALPCGYSFVHGSSDQSVGLLIEYTDYEAASNGILPDVAELPNELWHAELQFGTDLFANWCDDVISPDEPTPVVEERWSVVGGTLTQIKAPNSGGVMSGCGTEATALLIGLVVETPTGERIALGDIELRNPDWGCFAG